MLNLLHAPRCTGCDTPGAWLCLVCRDACEPERRARIHGAGTYGGRLRRAMRRFKYSSERALAAELGALVAGRVAGDLARGGALDVVVPAVSEVAGVRERGYDQAALLAAHVAARCGPPLRHVRAGEPQLKLDRATRAENVCGAFISESESLRGLRVALADDVATIEATLAAATGAIRAAGARDVRARVIALDE